MRFDLAVIRATLSKSKNANEELKSVILMMAEEIDRLSKAEVKKKSVKPMMVK